MRELHFWALRCQYKSLIKAGCILTPLYVFSIFILSANSFSDGVVNIEYYIAPTIIFWNLFCILFLSFFWKKVKIKYHLTEGTIEVFHFNKMHYSSNIKSLQVIKCEDLDSIKASLFFELHFPDKELAYIFFRSYRLGVSPNPKERDFLRAWVSENNLQQEMGEKHLFKQMYIYKHAGNN